MFKKVLLLALAVASVSANLQFTNCGSASTVHALRIAGCAATPCTFRRGTEYYGEMDLTKSVGTPSLPFVIQAILGFPLPPVTIFLGNACDDLRVGSCPTHNGQAVTARLYMDMPTTLPAISTNVRAIIRDSLNQVQGCAELPVTLV